MCFWWFLGGILLDRANGPIRVPGPDEEYVYYNPMLNCYVRDNPMFGNITPPKKDSSAK